MLRIKLYTLLLAGIALFAASAYSEVKQDFEVFRKWRDIQYVYPDRPITDFASQLNDAYLVRVKQKYEDNFILLSKLSPFLKAVTAGSINEQGYQIRPPLDAAMKNTLLWIYQALEQSPAHFVDFLKNNNFVTRDTNREEVELHFDYTIEKYKAFSRLLFAHQDSYQEDIYLFAVANRLVEYFFQNKTFPHYQELLITQKYHPIARLLHTLVWYNLIGGGWRHWHKNCLDALKQKADAGATVTYIAGGNDIYQLLKKGIYSIRIIDPFLPSQASYYADGWEWLVQGSPINDGIGDVINCTFDNTRLVLKRTNFIEGETFYHKTKDEKIVALKKSVTEWTVFASETNTPLGNIVFDRRFTNQDDFVVTPQNALLLSYDEMIYSVSPDLLNGWNIDPDKISDQANIYIKQFRNPVNKNMLKNMRIALLINLSDLKFIHFASDPN